MELQHHPQGAVRENVHLPVSRSWSYTITLKALLGRMFTFLSAGHGATTSPSRRCKGECSPSCQQVMELQHHPQGAIREVFTFLSAGHGATTSPSRRYKGQCSPSCQQVLELQHHPQGAVRGNVHLPVSRSWSYNITLKALLGRMFTFLSAGHGATTSPSRRYKGGVHLPVSRSCSYNITLKALLGRMFTFLTAGHRATTSPLRRC